MAYSGNLNYFAQLLVVSDHAAQGKVAAERAAGSNGAANFERRRVALQDMLHDRKPEPGTAGGAGAPRIDAVEKLGQTWNVPRLNADARVRHREMRALVVRPPAHFD